MTMRGRRSRAYVVGVEYERGADVLVRTAFGEWLPGVVEDITAAGDYWYVRTGPGQIQLRPAADVQPPTSGPS